MRSIVCALISFVCGYMGATMSKNKEGTIGVLIFISFCMLLAAFILMIIGV